jgi:DNA-binding transcriptional ArsR family regulator
VVHRDAFGTSRSFEPATITLAPRGRLPGVNDPRPECNPVWIFRPDLICDRMVTYHGSVDDDDRVFKALADPTRRLLLDRLFERDGRTLTELESTLDMTRFGVMKHLRVLEEAGLVVTRRSGREKLHFLNPIPIRQIHDRWIDKYTAGPAAALIDLKNSLEEPS